MLESPSPDHGTLSRGDDAPALKIEDLIKRYPTGTEALRGVSLEIELGRVLRPARPQRRRQVDADPLHDRPRAADLGLDPGLRPRRGRRLRRGAPGGRAGPAGPQPRLVPHRRGDARLPRRLLRDAARHDRRERVKELLETFSLTDKKRRAHTHPVGRHEAAADPGPGADAPAAPADPRRADRRRRRRAAAGALALRPADQRRRARRSCSPRTTSRRPSSSATGSPSSTTARSSPRGRARELAAALRRRQPRGRLPRAGRPQGALPRQRSHWPSRRRSSMSPAQIRFSAL